MVSLTEENQKNSEMSPQEDGSKALVNSPDEAKYVVDKSGDAKIDIGKAATVSGLTKEELMKYADDPFWVRTRWILFVLFWAGWLGMLVIAVIIIVRSPGCPPPPELKWVQESAVIEVDGNNLPTEKDLLAQCKAQAVTTVFFPGLIKEDDYKKTNYDAQSLFDVLLKEGVGAVAEMPGKMSKSNPLYQNFSDEGLLNSDDTLKYGDYRLADLMYENVFKFWNGYSLKGYLIPDESSYEVDKYVDDMNRLMEDEDGAIGNDVQSIDGHFGSPFDASKFRAFLEEEEKGNWSYYQFNPSYNAASSALSSDEIRLMNIALYLFSATPILPFGSHDNISDALLTELADFRHQDGIKFGATVFPNTTDNLVGYTRVYKGTPAYAVALNFGSENGVIDFSATKNVSESATLELFSSGNETVTNTREKVQLKAITLGPSEAKIMQFVANFG